MVMDMFFSVVIIRKVHKKKSYLMHKFEAVQIELKWFHSIIKPLHGQWDGNLGLDMKYS